jgi:hypothetical protein
MLGSIDRMHWRWDKCPTAWRGAYTRHKDGPTIILEVVASQDLWIWHAFFGLPGSLDDINVLNRSSLFQSPQGNMKVHFTRAHEAIRKDVERAFGVVQSRFAMVRSPARWWRKEDLWYIMQAYVLLHNMIIKDERDEEDDFNYH